MANFKDLEIKLKAAVETLRSPAGMKKIGLRAVEMVRLRTRLGYGVAKQGAVKERLKSLSRPYVGQRAEFKGLSDLTSPGKSNLTRTGQMLDSLDVKSTGTGTVKYGPTGERDDGLSNQEVAGYVSEKRPFVNLSNVEEKRIQDSIGKDLREEMQKNLTKR
jgi:hypothetical protein